MARIQQPPGATRQRARPPWTDTRHREPARTDTSVKADGRVRAVLQHVTRYVGEHPWIFFGGLATLMLVAGALSRTRL